MNSTQLVIWAQETELIFLLVWFSYFGFTRGGCVLNHESEQNLRCMFEERVTRRCLNDCCQQENNYAFLSKTSSCWTSPERTSALIVSWKFITNTLSCDDNDASSWCSSARTKWNFTCGAQRDKDLTFGKNSTATSLSWNNDPLNREQTDCRVLCWTDCLNSSYDADQLTCAHWYVCEELMQTFFP